MRSPEELRAAAKAVSAHYGADVFFYSGPIDDDGYAALAEAVTNTKQNGGRDKALLVLVTNGGLANSAYQIARLFQKMYKEFILSVPSYCKSAGTIIALGAHRLIMDPFSELGPLDVRLMKNDEIGARRSGLLSRSAFESLAEASFDLFEHLMLGIKQRSGGLVSFRLASEVSASMASTLMAPVYSQVNPEVLGSDYRDLQIAFHYGLRLIKVSRNAPASTVVTLVREYPSHDFIIDDDEARDLFERVEGPSDSLYDLVASLGEPAYDEARPAIMQAWEGRDRVEAGSGADVRESTGGVSHGERSEGPGTLDAGRKGDRTGHPRPASHARARRAPNGPVSEQLADPEGSPAEEG